MRCFDRLNMTVGWYEMFRQAQHDSGGWHETLRQAQGDKGETGFLRGFNPAFPRHFFAFLQH